MDHPSDLLEELVRQVRTSAKYRPITDEIVREVGARELAKRRSFREAVKETRNKLHQIGASYQEKPIPYADWMEALGRLPADLHDIRIQSLLQDWMKGHASTAERLSILPAFYAETLSRLAPVRSILDLACGLNPLALPWMPAAPAVEYTACDIYEDMTAFVAGFFEHFKVEGTTFSCDLTQTIPQTQAQLALLLKTIPCLDQVDKAAAGRLLRGVQAEYVLVSFPGRSLGGRSKGMIENYETRFSEIIHGESWTVQRFEFANELAFLIRK